MSGKDLGYVESRLLRISSTELSDGISSTNFRVQINSLMQNINRVSIKTVSFLNNFYNVTSTQGAANNTYDFKVNSVEYKGTITPGWYTTDSLMIALAAVVNSHTADGFTLTQDGTTVKVSAGIGGTDSITIYGTGTFSLLGFADTTVVNAGNSPQQATYLPSLQGLTTAFLRSTIMAPGFSFTENGEIGNILTPIPVKVPFGALNVMECFVDNLCEVTFKNPKDLSRIDFQLTDSQGNILDLQGGNLRIELRIFYDVS